MIGQQKRPRVRRVTRWLAVPLFAGAALLLCGTVIDDLWQPRPAVAQETPEPIWAGVDPGVADSAEPGLAENRRVPEGFQAIHRPVTEEVVERYIDPKTGDEGVRKRLVTRLVTEYQPIMPAPEQEQKLEVEAAKLAALLRDAKEPAEREKLTEQLDKVLRETFEQQQQRWAKQIEQLKAQLERLEQQRADRQEREDLIVQRRLSQLTDGVDPLAWEPAQGAVQPVLTRPVPLGGPASTTESTIPGGAPLARTAAPAKRAPVSPAVPPLESPRLESSPRQTPSPTAPLRTAASDLDRAVTFSNRSAQTVTAEAARESDSSTSADAAVLADRLIQTAASYLQAGERWRKQQQTGIRYSEPKVDIETARVRFELAHGAFTGLKQRLQLLVEVAAQKREAAQMQLEQASTLYRQDVISQHELAKAHQAVVSAQFELQQAELALDGWEQAARATKAMVERAEQLSKQLSKAEPSAESTPKPEAPQPPEEDPAVPDRREESRSRILKPRSGGAY